MTPARTKAPARKAAKKAAKKSAPGKKPSAMKAPAKAASPSKNGSAASRKNTRLLMDKTQLAKALASMADRIVAEFPSPAGLLILGIRTRGAILAERLRAILEKRYETAIPTGTLDITLYRDDLSALGPQPMVRDSEIPFDVTGSNIVLVDDVLYTGRTVRAAMDEIVDFGRPNRIRLAVLVSRAWREYPIQADYVGMTVDSKQNQIVRVHLSEIDDTNEVVLEGG